MKKGNLPKILVILGPTASGKSDLAVKLAKKYNGEIISADSRQIYRGMNIGTGKVPKDRLKINDLRIMNGAKDSKIINHKSYFSSGVLHHLLDVASPRHQFTVVQYQKLGNTAIKKILNKGKLPIIVGGTGFYIDALVNEFILPDVKPDLKLRKKLEKLSTDELFKRLQELDPDRAKIIDQHNKRRLIRALEIVMTTGKPVPKLELSSKYQVLSIGIKIPNDILKKRIHTRLVNRLKSGMVNEVKKLKANGLSWKKLDDFGLEYRWISRYLRGLITKQEMIAILEKEIQHYAKRQMTWFKRNKEIQWIQNRKEAISSVKFFLDK